LVQSYDSTLSQGNSIERGGREHEHPIEHQWHKRGDHETHVNHAVGREGEPTVLGTLGDTATLGLFRSRNGSTGVFSSDTDTKEESKILHFTSAKSMKNMIVAERGLAAGDRFKRSLFILTDKQ